MLTGLKLSSLVRKYVFYRPEQNAKGGSHEIEFWRSANAEMDRAEKLYEKNEVICLVFMFTPRVMVIKMLKMAHFCVFCWRHQNISHTLGKMFKCTWKMLLSFSENGMVHRLWSYHSGEIDGSDIKKLASQQKISKSCIFKDLAYGSSETNNL